MGEGQHSTMVSILALGHSCSGFDSQHSHKFFRGKIVDVTEFNQWHSVEDIRKWLENVDPTNIVLASATKNKQLRSGPSFVF